MTKKTEAKTEPVVKADPTTQELDTPYQQRLGAMLSAETLARSKQVRDSQVKQAAQRQAYEKNKHNQNQK